MSVANVRVPKPGKLTSYLRYALIGAIVGVITVAGRELLALLLPADTPGYYALSVAVVYAIGILLSYLGHRRVSFGHVDMSEQSTARSVSSFVAIALVGLVCTTVLSVVIRYVFPLESLLGAFSGAFAFAVATVLTSLLTFSLNARHSFPDKIES